ncbi:MAG: NUDIX hydrolase [Aeriscardovia sp.]|nr:NUDIX hydrolase [Aeriscardovia sp.]
MKYYEKLARKMNGEGEIDMEAPPLVLEDEKVYSCPIFSVHKKVVALAKKDGGREVIRRELVDHLAGVICLVHDLDTDSYLVEMEYRVGPGAFVFGLPAGLIERGEAPLEASKREVEEETGVRPGKIVEIEQYGAFYASEGASNDKAYLFTLHVSEIEKRPVRPDAGEFIKSAWVSFDDLLLLPIKNASSALLVRNEQVRRRGGQIL